MSKDMRPEVAERRFRWLFLKPEELIRLVMLASEPGGNYIRVPMFPSLPEGYTVVQIGQDWNRFSLGFLIAHPSYDPVPEHLLIPAIEDPCEVQVVKRVLGSTYSNIDD